MSESWKFKVEGRVQGVWFRESTLRQAKLLGLCGHAINCPDGSVEVLACGEAESIKVLAEWLKQGPPMAEVESICHVPFAGICPDRFTTG
jgi:acylphosphatase